MGQMISGATCTALSFTTLAGRAVLDIASNDLVGLD